MIRRETKNHLWPWRDRPRAGPGAPVLPAFDGLPNRVCSASPLIMREPLTQLELVSRGVTQVQSWLRYTAGATHGYQSTVPLFLPS
jgi:hypothetical protein